ncbi:MAG: LPS export ABC transporter periplasmic protein LptC [Bacteroidetes bacterium]|nr:LPS export ABC transporter periplasmic protein LptC [Bacteroidota bacterium]
MLGSFSFTLTNLNTKRNCVNMIISVALCTTGILLSCENSMGEIQRVDIDHDTPDEVSKDLRLVYSDSARAKIELYAATAEKLNGKQEITKLKDSLRVNFFNKKGKKVSTLFALYGEINDEKNMVFVRDSVRFYNFEKKQLLETEALFWNRSDSTVYTENQVIVKSPDGIAIGTGFRTKQDFSKYTILKPEGQILVKDSENKN